jgi:hypothetical protein
MTALPGSRRFDEDPEPTTRSKDEPDGDLDSLLG